MKELLENIKETLENLLPHLTLVEIDWGQLHDDQPEADFPCALVGIHQVTYSQQGNGYQIAEPEITVTVAARQPNRFGFGITPPSNYSSSPTRSTKSCNSTPMETTPPCSGPP